MSGKKQKQELKSTRDPIWKHFEVDLDRQTAKCKIDRYRKPCGHIFTSLYMTTVKRHLENFHAAEFAELQVEKKSLQAGKLERSSSTSSSQARMDNFVGKTYSVDSQRHKALLKQTALFLANPSQSVNTIELRTFRQLVHELDPMFKLPHYASISSTISLLCEQMKNSIKESLSGAVSRIALTADVWTKKAITSSYLGVTAHFVSKELKRIRVCLAELQSF